MQDYLNHKEIANSKKLIVEKNIDTKRYFFLKKIVNYCINWKNMVELRKLFAQRNQKGDGKCD